MSPPGSSLRHLCGLLLVRLAVLSSAAAAAADEPVHVVLNDDRITESSGMAASRRLPGFLWLHNDSGDRPRLFLVAPDGSTRAVLSVSGATAVDWEDMCSFEVNGDPWLLVADVGDNALNRGTTRPPSRLYLFREPDLRSGYQEISCSVEVDITVSWEGGAANCESVCVDPLRKEILLLEKSLAMGRLCRVPLRLDQKSQRHEAAIIAHLGLPFSTAMDLSADGTVLVVANMWNGAVVRRQTDETWAKALERGGRPLTLPARRQGETICFDADDRTIFVNSEGPREPLWRLPLPDDPEAK